MLDHTLDELLLAHLKAVPALAPLHCYTGQEGADHKLPALTVSTTSEPLAGSDTAFRGEVGVIVESEAHDTTAVAHGERVEAARSALADRATVIAALNATIAPPATHQLETLLTNWRPDERTPAF